MNLKLINLLLLLLLTLQSYAQNGLDTEVALSYQQASLKNIIQDLETRYEVSFAYGDLDLSIKESIDFNGELGEALKQLFQANDIEFRFIANQIVFKYNYVTGRPVKGVIFDSQSNSPLIGATVSVVNVNPSKGCNSKLDGYFKLEGLRIGRYDFVVQYLGYETKVINQVLVSGGKEIFLNIGLKESTLALGEVVVKVKKEPGKAVNDMANPNATSFSVEQTQRFAAAISDPARMVQAYAGVSSGGDDLSNEIVIRGNSSRGLLWRIEGIEVPNPNHFGGVGSGGGAISMLSSATLSDSDFYTGAFPAEYGNALSGVFDLHMRTGNTDRREHSVVLGNLGLEASSEGYFTKKSKASYLVNYRYSTIGLLNNWLPALGRQIPAYRDLSFKINVPTEKLGRFSLFGLRGRNSININSNRDPQTWEVLNDAIDVVEDQRLRLVGLQHRYLLDDDAYITTTLSASRYNYYDLAEFLNPDFNLRPDTIDESIFRNDDLGLTLALNKKVSAKHTFKTGLEIKNKDYTFDYKTIADHLDSTQLFVRSTGNTSLLQSYFQWKSYLSEKWELNSGVHFIYLFLNNSFGVDPRFSIKYSFSESKNIALSTGLHSKPEHPSTYFIERIGLDGVQTNPNLNLPLSKAAHFVLGYEQRFSNTLRFKVEAYYQHLFHIPVSEDPSTGFTALNSFDVFDNIYNNDDSRTALVGKGMGRNYGLEISLEKFFDKGYYYLLNTSLFESKYAGLDKEWYNTITGTKILFNALGGKEWLIGKKKKNVLGINAKFASYGGRRGTPIDLEASKEAGTQVQVPNSYYSIQFKPYMRFDLGLSYKINTDKVTHTFLFDLQNVTNRFNVYYRYYDRISETLQEETQNGFIPFMSYRLDFHL